MLDNFAIFILSHKRPHNILTINSLKKAGYTGDYYVIIDNKDSCINDYKATYGDKLIIFDKDEIAKEFDTGDNFPEQSSPVYVRNAIFNIAEKMGLKYFLQLDDDYTQLRFRYNNNGMLSQLEMKNMNEIIELMLKYLEDTPALSVAFSQGGDFVGGVNSHVFKKGIARKAMNAWFCKTDRKFKFIGKLNDDVNTYITLAKTGGIFFTIAAISLEQERTQQQQGGITDLYLFYGTYVKSFYTVMMNPSCTRINMMGNKDRRIHHKILWDKCAPKIISEEWKK